MNNFLRNLAKRSAGIPLATEYVPTTSPAFEDRLRSGAALDEIAFDDASSEPRNTTSPRSINVASGASTYDIQSAAAVDTVTPGPPKPEPITLMQTSSESESLSRTTAVFQNRPRSSPGPKSKTMDLQPAFASQDREVDERSGPPVQQKITVPQETTRVESNLRPLFSMPDGQTPVPPQVFAERTQEQAPGTREVSPADQAIRPAPTEPAISFQFPKVADAPSQAAGPLPIHVRVGRIEIRANATQQVPVRQTSKETAQLGFDGYQRLRRYRN